ncbi:MAG TPA: ABC transporter permease [Anaerolineales bacterium]|nr:ABC transporter permease [Anaerolineales bacterium]
MNLRARFALLWVAVVVGLSLLAPILSRYPPGQPVGAPLASPSSAMLLGADELGRDLWTRLVLGGRSSLSASALAAVITVILGIAAGLVAAVGGRQIDVVVVFLVNAALAIPGLLLALLLVAGIGPGLPAVILAVGFGGAPGFARLARQAFLQGQTATYISAAFALGAGKLQVALAHLLPNARAQLLPLAGTYFAWSFLGTTTLTFLGLGGDPANPEWGSMLNVGRSHLFDAPHLVLLPGLAIALTILAVHSLAGALAQPGPPTH